MVRITAVFVWAAALLGNLLKALATRPAGALLTTPTVVLYTAGPTPNVNSVIGDFTLATFSGYAGQVATLAGPVTVGLTTEAMVSSVLFIATAASPFVANTILGYLITDGAGAYYGGEQFATPVPIAAAGQYLALELVMPLTANALNA